MTEKESDSKAKLTPKENGQSTPTPKSPAVDESLALVAKRPAKGSAGKKVSVLTNSFNLHIPLEKIFLYTIEFTPDIPDDAPELRLRAVNHKSIRDKVISNYGCYFFENKHLLCLKKHEGESQYSNDDLTQTVTVKFLKEISMKDLSSERISQVEQITHLMLGKIIRASDLIRIGRHYFERNESLFTGNGGIDISQRNCPEIRIWEGYSITCERKMAGMHMNVDIVHRVLHKKSVGDNMEEIMQTVQNQKLARHRIEDMIKDTVVITVHNRRLYRISSIDWTLSIDDTFDYNGKKISYRDYFKDVYNEEVKKEMKGMLVHIPRGKKRVGQLDKILLPPELCHQTGLSKKHKSNFSLMKEIANSTRKSAHIKHKKRTKLVSRFQSRISVDNNYDSDSAEGSQKGKTMDASSSPTRDAVVTNGIATPESKIPLVMSNKAIKVDARVLPQFKISILTKDNVPTKVDPYTELSRSWNDAKFINKSVYKIRKWTILGEDKRVMEICATQIRNVSASANLLNTYISKSCVMETVPRNRSRDRSNVNNWRNTIEKVLKNNKPDILVCVLPDDREGNPTAVYNLVKTLCCTEIPVLTQCITKRNVMNRKRAISVFKGCVKQMLTKMGNTPWRANFAVPDKSIDLSVPTMICGMDVNHDMRRNCSTVSFVASYTSDYTKYNTFVYNQAFGREVMIEGGALIGEALKEFHKCNKTLPQNILIYRDGVSTAQLSVIVLHEVHSYKERFSKIKVEGKPYSPRLSVVVTQKNVSARFVDTKFKSLLPGTVIDSHVVSSKFWDFYLIPCGTTNSTTAASPTRFIVAYDEIGLSQDDASAITNQLCNIYFNIASAVRVPAPIQYAHKIAHMFGTAIENKSPCKELIGKPFFL